MGGCAARPSLAWYPGNAADSTLLSSGCLVDQSVGIAELEASITHIIAHHNITSALLTYGLYACLPIKQRCWISEVPRCFTV